MLADHAFFLEHPLKLRLGSVATPFHALKAKCFALEGDFAVSSAETNEEVSTR